MRDLPFDFAFIQINGRDGSACNRALHEDAVGQSVDGPFRAVPRPAGDFETSVEPVDGIADHASLPVTVSARINVRIASSILKALCFSGTAPASAAFAADS